MSATFSPAGACKRRPLARAVTRAKSVPGSLAAPIIDFCTVVIPAAGVEGEGMGYVDLFRSIFGTANKLALGALRDQPWNFFPRSATVVDESGNVAGKVGVAEDGKTCFSLTGAGCAQVPSWRLVESRLRDLGAHLTRLDIAVDDLAGECFSVDTFREAYHSGAFVMNGRPPQARFVSDEGSGKGCTLYIGQKGHKELCVYEKGKQLGDPDSRHTRCELRLYAKRLDLPLDALTNPGKYFGAAYPMLAQYVVGELERLHVREEMVNASWGAFRSWLRTQAGTGLQLIFDALGDDAGRFLFDEIARDGRPGRFKQYSGDLTSMIRANVRGAEHENQSDERRGRNP